MKAWLTMSLVVSISFFVFGKRIRKRDVYIKVRLKQRAGMANSYVFCISFHFARQTITLYPYRKKKA